jgi:uncharacterized phage protein gp47/JayE
LESVATEIANANNNSVLQTYSYDINTKSGSELDAFCNLFGVYRQMGKRASGLVTFSVDNVGTLASAILDIPVGTQVCIPVGGTYNSAVYFATTAPAIIGVGTASQDVPVVATLPGIIGNAPASTITSLVSPLVGITVVNNYNALTGGLDVESDDALRARWQNSAFNSSAGTYAKYQTTALQDPNVTLVNAIGTQNFYSEQLQIDSNLSYTATSGQTLSFVAYSGQTINNVTYSGTTTVTGVTISGGMTSTSLSTALNAAISGVYSTLVINSGFAFTVTPAISGSTLSGTNQVFTISANLPSPYRITLTGATMTSGVQTFGSATFYDFVQSSNPDVGASGTQSYSTFASGYLYPQGNELVGNNVNTYNQTTFYNQTDYVYPNNPTIQLALNISNTNNNSALFVGNTLQVVSEYDAQSSRSTTLASGNYIDIFIDGTSASSTIEQTVFNPSARLSPGNTTSYLNTNNYMLGSGSVGAATLPASGDFYIPLNQQPVINFPSQLSTSSSGVADTLFLYNTTTNSGITYPIALNTYGFITFTGTAASGSNFVSVNNANQFLYPGLGLGVTIMTSGAYYYISSVASSGVYLNQAVSHSGGTNVTLSGKAMVYPIYDVTTNQGSVLQTTALVLDSSTPPSGWPTAPSGISWIQYTHDYNSDVTTVESLIQQSRPLGVNTLVHQAVFVPLVVNAKIVFTNGYSQPTVMANINNQLSTYLSSLGYLGGISFATLASQILQVPGVTNAKILSVQTTAVDGTIVNTYSNDFILASNQLPTLSNIVYTIRGASNFNA